MVRHSIGQLFWLGVPLLHQHPVGARSTSNDAGRRLPSERATAEMPGWEDSDKRIEGHVGRKLGLYLWGDKPHHHPNYPRHEHNPWEDDKHYEPEPWYDDHDPWYEPEPWEEPCIPNHKGSWSEYAYDDEKDEDYNSGWRELEYDISKWPKDMKEEEKWWYDYEKKSKSSKSKGPKGMKGMKSKKGHKPRHAKPHKPKYRPCPTKEPSKTKVVSGSYDESYSGSYDEPYSGSYDELYSGSSDESYDDEKTERDDEIIVALTPFKIQFKVWDVRQPNESDISDIQDATMDLLQDYFVDVFVHKSGAKLNFVDVEVIQDKKPYIEHYMISVYFEAKVYFDGYSSTVPTMSQLDILLKHAFYGESLHDYHDELKTLPKDSVFHAATVFSISTLSNQGNHHGDYHEVEQWRPKDFSYQTYTPPDTSPKEKPDEDLIPHETVTTVGSEPLPETKSSSSPPVMIVTIVSSTTFVMSALFFVLYRQKALRARQQQLMQSQFPPPKNDGDSTAMVTMMEEDIMVECELGDDDYSAASKKSSRRSRAENFLRLMKDEDKTSGSPRRFLVANASRKGNT